MTKQQADNVLEQFQLLTPVNVTEDEQEGMPMLVFRFNNISGGTGVNAPAIDVEPSSEQLEGLVAALPLQETDRPACLTAFLALIGQ